MQFNNLSSPFASHRTFTCIVHTAPTFTYRSFRSKSHVLGNAARNRCWRSRRQTNKQKIYNTNNNSTISLLCLFTQSAIARRTQTRWLTASPCAHTGIALPMCHFVCCCCFRCCCHLFVRHAYLGINANSIGFSFSSTDQRRNRPSTKYSVRRCDALSNNSPKRQKSRTKSLCVSFYYKY